jgi:uncharacterized membrane protein
VLLLLWLVLGAGLRLANLDVKPPWTDEFNTIVLSLGNSFESVPLDRLINSPDLLAPLQPNPAATVGEVLRHVALQEHQPPLYFAIAHLWMQLFPPDSGSVSLWGARALPAVIGSLTIPVIYVCSYFSWRSPLIAHLTAAMFAVSPYGVYIAQEARHYSLAILWVAISISLLARAYDDLSRQQKLPYIWVCLWIVINNLALATNYLAGIAIVAEALGLGLFYLWQIRQSALKSESAIAARFGKADATRTIALTNLLHPCWQRLYLVALGTIAGCAYGWFLSHSYAPSPQAGWLDNTPYKSIEIVNPLFQIVGAAVSMLSLLLVEVNELPPVAILSNLPLDLNLPIIIVSALLMLIFFVWVLPMLARGIHIQLRQVHTQSGTLAVCRFAAISIGLYLVIPWLSGVDITRGARYQFVYFPALMMLVGLGLASCWHSEPSLAKWVTGKQAVAIVLLMGLVSSTIVATNYGYHKYYRPEQLVPLMQRSAPKPLLIATTHNSSIQVGELMGLAWELRRNDKFGQVPKTQFLLAHQFQRFCARDCPTTKILRETIDRISHPIDLWAINFYAPISLPPTCEADKKFTEGIYGYEYRLYHCQPIKDVD